MESKDHPPLIPPLPRKLAGRLRAFAEPLWFVLSVVLPLLIVTRRRPVLFSRPLALGDIICAFPAALELKKRHPGAAFIFHCREDFACLPLLAGVTRHVVCHLNLRAMETTYAFLFGGIYKFTYGDETENSVSTESVIAEYCRQHRVPVTTGHPRLEAAPAALRKVKALLQTRRFDETPFIILHAGPSWRVREWPPPAWGQLTEALLQNGFKHIIQIGSRPADAPGAALDQRLPGVWSLVNQLSLEESVALISLGRLLIGIDSGLLHVAAALRVPAVGLFGPTSPQLRFASTSTVSGVTAPVECQGCHHRLPRLHWVTGCPHDIACMNSLSPDKILQACLAVLKPATPAPAFSAASNQRQPL